QSQVPSSLSAPHIGAEDVKEVEIAGKILHFFVLSEPVGCPDAPTLLNSLCLQISEVIEAIEGCSSQAIQRFLAHLRALQEGDEVDIPEYVWLDRSRWEHQAITPVPLQEALSFWCQQSNTGNHWAKLVTKDALQVEEAVFGAFGWGHESMAEPSLAWNSDRIADGGLRVPKHGFTPPVYCYSPVEQTCADEEANLTRLQTRVGLP
ncbi:MAG: hypothetical protein AAGC93_31465, partial [Cyanobacteria bacterium P01_F01_bin.53]